MFTQNELGLRKSMWLELLKDYDICSLYHPCKDNVVTDALFRLSIGSNTNLEEEKKELEKYVHRRAQLGV